MSDLGALPVQAYLAACLLAGVIGVWLGRVAWVDRDEPGGTEVSLYLFCGGAVSLLYAVRVASASELAMIVALNLSTPLVAAVPGIWMAFVLAFSGHDRWRTENRTVALAAPPFVWVLTAWSSGTHGALATLAGSRRRGAVHAALVRARDRGCGVRTVRLRAVSPVSSSWSICTGGRETATVFRRS